MTRRVIVVFLGLAIGLLLASSGERDASAVEAGLNCETYEDGVCVVPIGDAWFCNETFQGAVCPSSIVAGEAVRWEYSSEGMSSHTSTECGTDCMLPVTSSMWDSGVLNPGDEFDMRFDAPGTYFYHCSIHPFQQGIIRVLAPMRTPGDVDCSASITAVDAALVLQHSAALLNELPCPDNGDPSADGQTNSLDAALILQYSAGLIEGF